MTQEPDWRAIWLELARSSDRSAVIVGNALLEESLGRLLASYFVDCPEVAARVIEPGDRPINLKRGADLAFCLGLITAFELEELRAVADLRNRFAHVVEGASFEDESARKSLQRLMMHRRFMKGEDETPHWQFGAAVSLLFFDLESRAQQQTHLELRPASGEQQLHCRVWLQQMQEELE